jgi:nicotinamide-nucleotide amidase
MVGGLVRGALPTVGRPCPFFPAAPVRGLPSDLFGAQWACVTIELVNTGSELMLGRVLNTHQQWICRTLADRGYTVDRQVAISDDPEALVAAVREGLARADWVITTGGLGPTCDDRTRELVASMLGRTLKHDPAVEAQIRSYFEGRNRPVPARTKVEAMVPDGAEVLVNRHGTAPGLALWLDPNPFRPDGRPTWLVMLPGPPRELRPMVLEEMLPRLDQRFPRKDGFACRTLKTTGLGESYMEELLDAPLKDLVAAGMDLGFCARVGEVDVRFVARGPQAQATVAEAERRTRAVAGNYIFGVDDETLEAVLVRDLSGRGLTLALAESCTGGHIANRVTNVPGASAVLRAGLVTYANEAKESFLGVPRSLLVEHGAVSEPVARAMAEGVLRATGADFAIAVTGIAGPGGAVPGKPVGTVFIAVAGPGGVEVRKMLNAFDRETFKYITAQQAMAALLRKAATGQAWADGTGSRP